MQYRGGKIIFLYGIIEKKLELGECIDVKKSIS